MKCRTQLVYKPWPSIEYPTMVGENLQIYSIRITRKCIYGTFMNLNSNLTTVIKLFTIFFKKADIGRIPTFFFFIISLAFEILIFWGGFLYSHDHKFDLLDIIAEFQKLPSFSKKRYTDAFCHQSWLTLCIPTKKPVYLSEH